MEHRILNNGVEMPVLGFGVYQVGETVCEQCVRCLLYTSDAADE